MSENEANETQEVPAPKKSGGGQKVDAPRGTYFKVNPRKLTVIGIDTKDGPEHPLYDARIELPIDPLFVKSIKTRGVQEVIKATKIGDKLVVWSGRRRTIHARVAMDELEKSGDMKPDEFAVPVIVTTDEAGALWSKGLTANRHRLDDGVLASARAAQKAIDLGGTIESVATDMGVSDQTIRNWQQLLGLAPAVIKAVEAGTLGTTAALMLAPLAPDKQVEQLKELAQDKAEGAKITVASTRAKVNSKRAGRPTQEANRVTPKERVEKAVKILHEYAKVAAGDTLPKDVAMEALKKLSRALAGRAFEKLADDE